SEASASRAVERAAVRWQARCGSPLQRQNCQETARRLRRLYWARSRNVFLALRPHSRGRQNRKSEKATPEKLDRVLAHRRHSALYAKRPEQKCRRRSAP